MSKHNIEETMSLYKRKKKFMNKEQLAKWDELFAKYKLENPDFDINAE